MTTISPLHWIIALIVAGVAHLAGLLWLSQPWQRAHPPTVDSGIVIRLEPGPERRRQTVAALSQPRASSPTLQAQAAKQSRRPEAVVTERVQSRPTQPAAEVETIRDQLESEPAIAPPAIPSKPPGVPVVAAVPSSQPTPTITLGYANEAPSAATVASDAVEQAMGRDPLPVSPVVDPAPLAAKPVPPVAAVPATESATESATHMVPPVQPELVDQIATESSLPNEAVIALELDTIRALMPADLTPQADQEIPRSKAAPAQDADTIETEPVKPPPEIKVLRPTETVTARAAPPREAISAHRDSEGVTAEYAGLLKGWLQRNMRYPREAWLQGQQGTAVVSLSINRDGKVLTAGLRKSSGHALLDREAMAMLKRADPFPAMPMEMIGDKLELRVPVSFLIKDYQRQREIPPIYLK